MLYYKFMRGIIKRLCSIKITLFIIFLIVFSSCLGTLIPDAQIYSSWWFISLLACLFLNLLMFTIDRLLRRIKYTSTIIVHISIMLILLGGLIGAVWGSKGYIEIKEGEIYNSYLPFKIRLVDFELETYEPKTPYTAPHIKDFKSKLELIEGDSVVLTKTIEVNDPLTYKGWTIYQANYNPEDLKMSGLYIKKDPGVGIVYTGFILLIFGIAYIFFIKPINKKYGRPHPNKLSA